MANPYSIIHNYDTTLFTPNFDLIASAMQYKQNKIDANRQRLQTMYDQLSVVDVAKDADKDYVESRLQTAKSIANKYAALDLSSSNLTNQLISKLTDVVDDNVKNAVLSTRRYRSEQAAWDKLKEDDPEKYSQLNRNYAMQGANSWLNDGKVGSEYKGGGGVIEFVDLSEKIMDNLPELQKALKAEWIETGPKQGYFRSMDTYEAVDRGQMQEALSFLFNEKDKRQMGINAWGTYDSMPEEQLKEEYNAYFQPRIDKVNEKLNAIDIAIGKAKTNGEKEQLLKTKKLYQDAAENLQKKKYDNVAGTYGRESAYTNLYTNQFNNSILDTYSYGPRLIERKVDEIDKANKEYQLKLQAESRAQEKDEFDRKMKIAELEMKRMELEAEYPGLAGPVVKGKAVEMDTPDVNESALKTALAEESQARESVKSTFGLTDQQLASQDFMTSLDHISENGYITVDGKEVEVSQDQIPLLLDYKNKVVANSEDIETAIQATGDMLTTMGNQVARMAYLESTGTGKVDFDSENSIPEFNFRIQDGKVVATKEGEHYATKLYAKSAKGGLSEDEKMTLDLYNGIWLHNDDAIDEESRTIVGRYLNKKLSNLSQNEASKIDLTVRYGEGENMPNTHGVINSWQDYYLNEISGADLEFSGRDYRGVDDEEKDFIMAVRKQLDSSDSPKATIENILTSINESVTERSAERKQMPFLNRAVLPTGSKQHEALRLIAGISDDYKKSEYQIEKVIGPDGQPTDINKITYTTSYKDDNKTIVEEVEAAQLTDAQLDEAGIVAFETTRTMYDAKNLGDMAATVSLGNNIYSKKKRDRWKIEGKPEQYITTTGEWAKDVLNEVLYETKSPQVVEVVAKQIQDYRAGNLSFDLVPKNNMYQMSISDANGNNLYYYTPLDRNGKPIQMLFSNQIAEFMQDPRVDIEAAFSDYLANLKNDAYVNLADRGGLLDSDIYNLINQEQSATSRIMTTSFQD